MFIRSKRWAIRLAILPIIVALMICSGFIPSSGDQWMGISPVEASDSALQWKPCISGETVVLYDVGYGNGRFVAVGDKGVISSSTDGYNWTHQDSGSTSILRKVAWADGNFVAVGDGGTILTSTNGTKWSNAQSSGTDTNLYGAVYAKGQWLAVGDSQTVIQSKDTQNWVGKDFKEALDEYGNPSPAYRLLGITYGNNVYLAAKRGGSFRKSSDDGNTWGSGASIAKGYLSGISYNNGVFVASGSLWDVVSSGLIATSIDGSNWTSTKLNVSSEMTSSQFDNGQWMAVGGSGEIFSSSDNAKTWNAQISGSKKNLKGVVGGNGVWVAVGDAGTILTTASATGEVESGGGTVPPTTEIFAPKSADSKKIWTIRLNQNLLAASANAQSIYVHDAEGNSVTVGIDTSEPKAVKVSPPSAGWTQGKSYTLFVTQDLKTTEGNALASPIKMKFVVFNEINQETAVPSSQIVAPSDKEQVIASPEGVQVSLPPNLLKSSQTLTIAEVKNPPAMDASLVYESKVFAIAMGDLKNFDQKIKIELPLDAAELASSNVIMASYWDQDRLQWVIVPAHVDQQRKVLSIMTNHLTNWRKVVLRSDIKAYEATHFVVLYNPADTVNTPGSSAANATQLAQTMGISLDQAYNNYFKALGSEISPDYSTKEVEGWLGNKSMQDNRCVVCRFFLYNGGGAEYDWMLKELFLPTSYADVMDLQTTLAHELFHAFQNNSLTFAEMASSRWLIEASAEYASYYLAWDQPIPIANLHTYASPSKALSHFDGREAGHEYGMANFIKFAVNKGASFPDMWRAIVVARPALEHGFDNYVLSTTGKILPSLYEDFWHGIISDSNCPSYESSNILQSRFMDGNLTHNIKAAVKENNSMSIFRMRPRTFSEHTDSLKWAVEVEGEIPEGVYINVFKLENFNLLSHAERKPGGSVPVGTLYRTSDKKIIFVDFKRNNNDIMFITVYGERAGSSFNVKVSQIDLQVTPSRLDNGAVNNPVSFEAVVNNLPSAVEKVRFSFDFSDGTDTLESSIINNNNGGASYSYLHKYSSAGSYAAKVAVYDYTLGYKGDLLGDFTVPITILNPVVITGHYVLVTPKEPNLTTIVGTDGYIREFGGSGSSYTTKLSWYRDEYREDVEGTVKKLYYVSTAHQWTALPASVNPGETISLDLKTSYERNYTDVHDQPNFWDEFTSSVFIDSTDVVSKDYSIEQKAEGLDGTGSQTAKITFPKGSGDVVLRVQFGGKQGYKSKYYTYKFQ